MKKLLLIIIVTSLVIIGGCFPFMGNNEATEPPLGITNVTTTTEQEVKSIKGNTKTITDDAAIIKKATPDKIVIAKAENIQEHASLIDLSADVIQKSNEQLISIEVKYQTEMANLKQMSDKKVGDLSKQLTIAKEELVKAKNNVNGWLYKGIIAIFGVILALSIVMIFLGNKLGIPVAGGSLAAIAVFIALQRFELIFGIIALVLALFVIGTIFYDKWKAYKEIAVKDTALSDVVKMIDEVIKPALPTAARVKIFGELTPEKPIATRTQSVATQKIVAKLRAKTKKE